MALHVLLRMGATVVKPLIATHSSHKQVECWFQEHPDTWHTAT
jgi:hypothetical protein